MKDQINMTPDGKMRMYLITYMTEHRGGKHYGYATHDDPIQFILDCQHYPETYYLINAQYMTPEQYRICKGNLKGM
jgi:hypothetical protein